MPNLLEDIIQILINYRWSLDPKAITKRLVESGKYRDYRSMRLSQVAKILNKGLVSIANSLSAKGFKIDINPNSKIYVKQLILLSKEFNFN